MVGTLDAVGGFAYALHGGQQERNQDRDNGHDHQQLDERETRWLRCLAGSNGPMPMPSS
jgi:hypothetical protein